MRLWRCQSEQCSTDPHGRLIFDFMNETGVCPTCGADPNTPEGAQTVIQRAVIHLVVKDKDGPIATGNGRLKLACQPAAKALPKFATGATAAVTCPLCLNTETYAKAHEATRPVAENEVPAGVPLG